MPKILETSKFSEPLFKTHLVKSYKQNLQEAARRGNVPKLPDERRNHQFTLFSGQDIVVVDHGVDFLNHFQTL